VIAAGGRQAAAASAHVEDTPQSHQLLGQFANRYGAPTRTFVLGISMGGAIGLKLTETYPDQIDGSLLVSGVVGGSRAEVNYIGDVRVLWDYFYPGTIPGSLFDVPQGADEVNAGIARYQATRDAEAFLARAYEPRGTIRVPVLTLHGTRDPVVPIFHEALLAQRAAERGNSQYLLQQTRDGFGHVVFPPDAIPQAFLDLVTWVTTGSRPAV